MFYQFKTVRKIFNIEDSFANKMSYYLVLLFLVSLPFDSFYSRVILIGLATHTAFHIKNRWFVELSKKDIYVLTSLYFLSLICFTYSVNVGEGGFDLTKELGILVFPLIFAFTTLDIFKYKNRFLFAFSLSCLVAVIFLYTKAFQVIIYFHLPFSFLFSESLLNQHFSQPLDLHATYFSMYLGVALIFLVNELNGSRSITVKTFFGILILVLIAALIQLASRSVFISMCIIMFTYPFFVLRTNKRLLFILFVLLILSGAIIFIRNNEFFYERYMTDLKHDLNPNRSDGGRAARWAAIKELIIKRPLLGYGTGSETQILKAKYLEKKMYTAYSLGLNSHNQYLGYCLRSGLIGLVVYLLALFFGFYQVVRRRDILFFGFLVIVSIVSFSENILDVNKGIFFYSFFFSFFVYSGRNIDLMNV
jgi:O-antigen ligase